MKIENLINAIGVAAQEAHKIMEQNYVSNFFNIYFHEENLEESDGCTYKPKTVDIVLSDSENSDESKVVSAPVAALVRHTNMNLDYIKLNLNINVINENEDKNKIEVTSQNTNDRDGNDNVQSGEIEILFKSQNAPEGVSRIETYLNGSL